MIAGRNRKISGKKLAQFSVHRVIVALAILQKIRFMARIDNRFPPGDESRARYEREDFAAADDALPIDDLSNEVESSSDSQFMRAQRRVAVRKGPVTKKTAQRLRWTVIAAAVIGALTVSAFWIGYYATTSWRFRIESGSDIETAGLTKVTRAQVMSVMGGDIGRNTFKVALGERKRKLEEIAWVESATVMRLLPDKLRVHIVERQPVAFVRVGSRVAFIDTHGVIMEMPARLRDKYSFPVITGMLDSEPLSTRAARMKIYTRLLEELDGNNLNHSRELSEVDLSDPDDVKVMVEDAGGALLIHLGASDFLNRYRVYVRHINDWRQQFQKLYSVDLRFNGQIIVNPDTRHEKTLR